MGRYYAVTLPQPGNARQPTMARLAAYDGLLPREEAVRYLRELMGPFAPGSASFKTYVRPSFGRRLPNSAEARYLVPTARNVGGGHRSGWTREQLRAYAEARATHRIEAPASPAQPAPSGP